MKNVLEILKSLSFEEILDWVDYAEFEWVAGISDIPQQQERRTEVRKRRKGKTPVEHLALNLAQAKAITEFRYLKRPEQELTIEAAKAVANALRPRINRRRGEGNIVAKKIRRYLYDLEGNPLTNEDGSHAFVEYGPYLYLKIWRTGGDWDSKKRKLSMIYIGGDNEGFSGPYPYRLLALEFYNSLDDSTGRRQRTDETEALEHLLMQFIDLSVDPPKINHPALLELEMSPRLTDS